MRLAFPILLSSLLASFLAACQGAPPAAQRLRGHGDFVEQGVIAPEHVAGFERVALVAMDAKAGSMAATYRMEGPSPIIANLDLVPHPVTCALDLDARRASLIAAHPRAKALPPGPGWPDNFVEVAALAYDDLWDGKKQALITLVALACHPGRPLIALHVVAPANDKDHARAAAMSLAAGLAR